jgi:hypothetical protein
MLEHQHYNRIKVIIENPANNVKHLEAIRNLLTNYQSMFGTTKLYNQLLLRQSKLILAV